MLLTTNFYKIAKNILKRRTRPLTSDEKSSIIQYITERNMIVDVVLISVVGLVFAGLILYAIVAILSQTNII